jgi:uncharacterized cupredoxin-like copper-binding protein
MTRRSHRFPARRALLGVLAATAAIGAAAAGYMSAPAASQQQATAPTLIKVTAGKPSEFAFTVSKTSAIPAGAITFKFTNRGALPHAFKICTTPSTNAKANTCTGKSTALVPPGKSASLSVTLSKAGTYEFLSSSPTHAAKGMKGILALVLAATGASTTTSSTTTAPPLTTTRTGTTATTTTTPPSTASGGDTSAGASLFVSAGCSSCHTLAEVRGFGTTIGPNLNVSHPMSFPNGPLSSAQLADLAAYINGR